MVSSLRHMVYKNYGKICYLHYFRRMIKDYESGKWDFDITTIVKNIKVEVPCPKYDCKNCGSIEECMLAKKLSKKEEHIYKVTRLVEILYGNLNHGYWADLVKT